MTEVVLAAGPDGERCGASGRPLDRAIASRRGMVFLLGIVQTGIVAIRRRFSAAQRSWNSQRTFATPRKLNQGIA